MLFIEFYVIVFFTSLDEKLLKMYNYTIRNNLAKSNYKTVENGKRAGNYNRFTRSYLLQ